MPNWLSIALGVLCLFWALMQFRMTLIYMGVIESPTLGSFDGPQVALMQAAISSALSFLFYGVIFFFVGWPKLITYILAVLTLKAFVDLSLILMGVGAYRIYAVDGALGNLQTESGTSGRATMLRSKVINLAFYLIVLAIAVYFLGF